MVVAADLVSPLGLSDGGAAVEAVHAPGELVLLLLVVLMMLVLEASAGAVVAVAGRSAGERGRRHAADRRRRSSRVEDGRVSSFPTVEFDVDHFGTDQLMCYLPSSHVF